MPSAFSIKRDGVLDIVDVDHDSVPPIESRLAIDRWRLRLLGWHCATMYRYDLIHGREQHHMSIWSLHVSPLDRTGFAVSPPPWLIRALGLSRDYGKPAQ